MTTLAGPPSPLGDVFRCVLAAFSAAVNPTPTSLTPGGDATPIQVGKGYLKDFGAGTPPRILIVRRPKGVAGPVLEIGGHEIGSRVHTCDVYVRGTEDGSDVGRYDGADELSDRLQNALAVVAGARVVFGSASEDAQPIDADAYGADDAWSFEYTRAVFRDDAIQAGAHAAVTSLSPADPARLHGGSGLTPIISVTTADARP